MPAIPPTQPCPRCGGDTEWTGLKEIRAMGGEVVRIVGTSAECLDPDCHPISS